MAAAAMGFGAVVVAVPASAQNHDGVYRGTLVCVALPFAKSQRSAIEITITGASAKYSRPVLASDGGNLGTEAGNGVLVGDQIQLNGNWKGEKDSFEAAYTGNFVRRQIKFSGAQTWSHDQKTFQRTCTGSAKRPLRLLPKPAA
jgi:hypothetical protein